MVRGNKAWIPPEVQNIFVAIVVYMNKLSTNSIVLVSNDWFARTSKTDMSASSPTAER